MTATKWNKYKRYDYHDYELKPEFLPDGVEGIYLGFECTRRPRRNAYIQPMYSVRIAGRKRAAYLASASKNSRAPHHDGRRIYTLRTAKQRGDKYGRWPWWLAKHGIVCGDCFGVGCQACGISEKVEPPQPALGAPKS